jgi:mono/diheme cytochrome c family protein
MSCTNLDHATRPTIKANIAWGMGLAMVLSAAFAVVILLVVGFLRAEAADRDQIQRGKYLVTLALCTDCHTPGYFFGKPDMNRFLGGSEVGFEIPGLGVFHGPNLTPDIETGIGQWSADDIVRAFQTGTRPDGRILAPIMPWHAFAELTKEDAYAIAAFLKNLPPVSNKVPGPFGPTDTPTSFVFRVVAPSQANPTQ